MSIIGQLYHIYFMGDGYTIKGDNSNLLLTTSENGSTLKGKNLLPVKNAKTLRGVSSPLKKYYVLLAQTTRS